MCGYNDHNQPGQYGKQGFPGEGNVPGARLDAVSWIDSNDNLWLFGGSIYKSDIYAYNTNDLWKFDGAYWTWVSGGEDGTIGSWGTQGVSSASNLPFGKTLAVAWRDHKGTMWLFGGYQLGSDHLSSYYVNDLWKYQP